MGVGGLGFGRAALPSLLQPLLLHFIFQQIYRGMTYFYVFLLWNYKVEINMVIMKWNIYANVFVDAISTAASRQLDPTTSAKVKY